MACCNMAFLDAKKIKIVRLANWIETNKQTNKLDFHTLAFYYFHSRFVLVLFMSEILFSYFDLINYLKIINDTSLIVHLFPVYL